MRNVNLGAWYNPLTWFASEAKPTTATSALISLNSDPLVDSESYIEKMASQALGGAKIETYTESMASKALTTHLDPALTTGDTWQVNLKTLWDTIGGTIETLVDLLNSQKQAEAVVQIAQAEADAKKTALALTQAQQKLAEIQAGEQSLFDKIWEGISPYAIPISAGLVMLTLLLLSTNGKEKR